MKRFIVYGLLSIVLISGCHLFETPFEYPSWLTLGVYVQQDNEPYPSKWEFQEYSILLSYQDPEFQYSEHTVTIEFTTGNSEYDDSITVIDANSFVLSDGIMGDRSLFTRISTNSFSADYTAIEFPMSGDGIYVHE